MVFLFYFFAVLSDYYWIRVANRRWGDRRYDDVETVLYIGRSANKWNKVTTKMSRRLTTLFSVPFSCYIGVLYSGWNRTAATSPNWQVRKKKISRVRRTLFYFIFLENYSWYRVIFRWNLTGGVKSEVSPDRINRFSDTYLYSNARRFRIDVRREC